VSDSRLGQIPLKAIKGLVPSLDGSKRLDQVIAFRSGLEGSQSRSVGWTIPCTSCEDSVSVRLMIASPRPWDAAEGAKDAKAQRGAPVPQPENGPNSGSRRRQWAADQSLDIR